MLTVAHVGDDLIRARRQAGAGERGAGRFAQHAFFAGILPEVERMAGMRLYRQSHVIERGEIQEQRCDLERACESQCATLIDGQVGDIAAVEMHAAGVRRNFAAQLPDQRGLAGTVRTNDRVQFAARDIQHDAVGGQQAAEALGQPINVENANQPRRRPEISPSMPPRA